MRLRSLAARHAAVLVLVAGALALATTACKEPAREPKRTSKEEAMRFLDVFPFPALSATANGGIL